MNINSIAIGSDHAGYECKQYLIKGIKDQNTGLEITDMGTYSADSVDYPDFAHQVAEKVSSGLVLMGIVICGSGNGVCMTANRHKGVRAALCWNEEIARLARQHNNANILCIPARFVTLSEAAGIVKTFLETNFEGGRHVRRAEKIEL
jgi:ribose 5-phosphate isomerase B